MCVPLNSITITPASRGEVCVSLVIVQSAVVPVNTLRSAMGSVSSLVFPAWFRGPDEEAVINLFLEMHCWFCLPSKDPE